MDNLKNKVLTFLDNLFIYKETNKYDFFLPENEDTPEKNQKTDDSKKN